MAREDKGKKIFFISSAAFLCLFLLTVVVLVKYANVIARGGIEKALGEDFSVDAIELRWGSVEVVGITMKNAAGKEVIKIGELVVKAYFMSFLRKQYIISSITVKDPYIYVETGRSGNIVSPVLPWQGTTTKIKENDRPEKAGGGNPVVLKKVVVVNGAVDYYDRKSPKTPVLTKFREVNLEMHDLTVPFTEDLTRYAVTAVIEGSRGHATLKSQGNIRFANRDMDFTGSLRNLDITHFKPYYQQAGNANIAKGILDVDLRGNVVSNRINAPGKALLKDLEFESGRGGNRFLGIPLSLVVTFLKGSGGQIPVDFVIAGDLDNPRFNLTENFVHKLSFGLADKLGFSISDLGESLIGAGTEGTKKVGESIKGIGERLRNIFGK